MTRFFFALVILLLLFYCFPNPCFGKCMKKMVVVTINNTTFEDLVSNDVLRGIAQNGSVGLMNTRSSGNNNQYKPYLTLGTGERSDIYFDCLESYVVDENIKKYFEDITLFRCNLFNIVNPSINLISSINSKTLYKSQPGKLGSLLRKNGFRTAFIGGFWYDNSIKSPAFFINMDKAGLVDGGEIDKVFKSNQIDTDELMKAYKTYISSSDFVIIELGDIESLFANKRLYNEASYEKSKIDILDRYGKLMKSLIESIDFSDTVLYIMSPYSADILSSNRAHLSPIIIYDGGKNRGILTSQTTKRLGIVSALDFAPYVCSYYNIKNDGFSGYPFEFKSLSENVDYVQKLDNITYGTSLSRIPILRGYAFLIIFTLVLAVVKILKEGKLKSKLIFFLMQLLLIIPLFMLIEGLLMISNLSLKAFLILASSMLFTIILNLIVHNKLTRLIVITALNFLIPSADLFTGANMLRYSVLSYDPIIGARYYGLGNEFLGVIIGSTMVFCICILEKSLKYKKIGISVLIFVTILIGFPWFGSNVGGFITAIFCFSFFMLIEKGHIIKNALKISGILAIFSIPFIFFINTVFKSIETHLTLLVKQTDYYGIIYLWDIILRKVTTSLRLSRYSLWSIVMILFIISAAIIFSKFKYNNGKQFLKGNILKKKWAAVPAACLAAIALNDSGIVTAAFIMLYGFFGFVLLSDFNVGGL